MDVQRWQTALLMVFLVGCDAGPESKPGGSSTRTLATTARPARSVGSVTVPPADSSPRVQALIEASKQGDAAKQRQLRVFAAVHIPNECRGPFGADTECFEWVRIIAQRGGLLEAMEAFVGHSGKRILVVNNDSYPSASQDRSGVIVLRWLAPPQDIAAFFGVP